MSTPTANIYDLEGQMYSGLTILFDDSGNVLWTPNNAPKEKKERPRTEALFVVGQEKKSYHVFADGSRRNATWFASLSFEFITDSGNVASHREYRALIRSLLAPGIGILNGSSQNGVVYLPYHRIQLATETGTTQEYRAADGFERSRINYSIEFGIDHGAWAELGLTAIN